MVYELTLDEAEVWVEQAHARLTYSRKAQAMVFTESVVDMLVATGILKPK